MQEATEDLEKLEFYINAKFEFCESLLFSNLVRKPSSSELAKIKSMATKNEIERLYNHFHLASISDNIAKQRKCAAEIWKAWRSFFIKEMKDKNIAIEIYDSNEEVIIYVHENVEHK